MLEGKVLTTGPPGQSPENSISCTSNSISYPYGVTLVPSPSSGHWSHFLTGLLLPLLLSCNPVSTPVFRSLGLRDLFKSQAGSCDSICAQNLAGAPCCSWNTSQMHSQGLQGPACFDLFVYRISTCSFPYSLCFGPHWSSFCFHWEWSSLDFLRDWFLFITSPEKLFSPSNLQ